MDIQTLNNRQGTPAPNQIEVLTNNGCRIFYSYTTLICILNNSKKCCYLRDDIFELSSTTKKFLSIFLESSFLEGIKTAQLDNVEGVKLLALSKLENMIKIRV